MPLGRLIDSRNRVRLLMAGVLVWAAAMAATGFAQDVWLLLICRAALGLVAALLVPASISLLADLFPPKSRTVAISLFTVGQAVGQAVGILVGGKLFDALDRLFRAGTAVFGGLTPWRVLYLGAAAAALVLLPLLVAVREPVRQERDGDAGSTVTAMRRLWSYRGFIGPLLAALLFAMIPVQAALVWASPLLIRRFGQSPGEFAGWLSAIILLGGILGTLAGGRLAESGRRRRGPRGVLLPALLAVLALVPLSFFALAPTVSLFGAMLALELFCAGVIPTVGVIAFTLNIPNEIRGLGLGIYALVVALFGTATAPADRGRLRLIGALDTPPPASNRRTVRDGTGMTAYAVSSQLPWKPNGTRWGRRTVATGPRATSRASSTTRSLACSRARQAIASSQPSPSVSPRGTKTGSDTASPGAQDQSSDRPPTASRWAMLSRLSPWLLAAIQP